MSKKKFSYWLLIFGVIFFFLILIASLGVLRLVSLKDIRTTFRENKNENSEKLPEGSKESEAAGIVGLNISFTPEGNLSKEEREKQRQEILKAQEDLIKKLSGYKFSVIKKFDTIPAMALRVDEKTLIFLKSLPEVKSIEEDKPVGF